MKKIKILCIVCLSCICLILLSTETVIGYTCYSHFFAHVKMGSTDINYARVEVKNPYNYYILQFKLTSFGWAYYGYVQSGSYDILVNGVKVRSIYINGYGPYSQVYAPPWSYVDATCRLR